MKPLYPHQEEFISEFLKLTDPDIGRVAPGAMLCGFTMRLGKSRTAIEIAQRLFLAGEIDHAIVVCPAPVRSVWFDEALGQIAEYSAVPVEVSQYRSKVTSWFRLNGSPAPQRCLRWTVTNYEFIRQAARLKPLLKLADFRTLLILDESSYIKSPSSQQTKACYALRKQCGRVLLLNGTPEGDDPGDLYAPCKILDTAILGYRTWGEYKANYAVLGKGYAVGGREFQTVVSWKNLDELGRRTAPYFRIKTAAEVVGMPKTLAPVMLTATLSPETWRMYQEMRKDAVAWLTSNERVTAAQAAVKVLRLSQLTSGFLGGVVDVGEGEVRYDGGQSLVSGLPRMDTATREIGREKLDVVLRWLEERRAEDPNFRVVLWCRFRAEAERLHMSLSRVDWNVDLLVGGQNEADRASAVSLLAPAGVWRGSRVRGASALVGTERTGGMGLDFSGASCAVHVSNGYSRMMRLQADARILGPHQGGTAAYFDVVAEGPAGQKTIDHVVLSALRDKRDLASITAREWGEIL